jgi:hypothetical protein
MLFVVLSRRVTGIDKVLDAIISGSILFTIAAYIGSDGGERQEVLQYPV